MMEKPKTGASESPESSSKISQRVMEMKSTIPPDQRAQVLRELKEYLDLRRLSTMPYRDLPERLREEIGAGDPRDAFIQRAGDFDPWFDMMEIYGAGDDTDKWSIEEVEELIERLEG